MASFVVKSMVGGPLKSLAGGLTGGGEGGGDKGGGDAGGGGGGMTRDEFEEYRKQLLEEKMERDAHFTQKKAERATVRTHFREKYRLPKGVESLREKAQETLHGVRQAAEQKCSVM